MRLTRFGRIFAMILAVGAGGWLGLAASDNIAPLFAAASGPGNTGGRADDRMLVYRLSRERPLRFAFSRPAGLVRIVSQPLVDSQSWEKRDNWVYGYRIVLRDSDGAEILTRDVYSRALHPRRILPFKRPSRFIRNSPLRIAVQDDVVISSDPEASTVEVTPLSSDPEVREIDLRIYERLPFIGRSALAAYLRRSPEEQAQIAAGSALPAAMLDDNARAALMTNQWRVVGPMGVPGRDYTVVVVYETHLSESGDMQGE